VITPPRRRDGSLSGGHRRGAHGAAAVAAAVRDHMLAVEIGIGQVGIAAAVARNRVIDHRLVIVIESSLTCRAEGMAGFSRAQAYMGMDREIAVVTGAHAEDMARTGHSAFGDALLRNDRQGRARLGIGGHRRWAASKVRLKPPKMLSRNPAADAGTNGTDRTTGAASRPAAPCKIAPLLRLAITLPNFALRDFVRFSCLYPTFRCPKTLRFKHWSRRRPARFGQQWWGVVEAWSGETAGACRWSFPSLRWLTSG